MNYDFIKFCFSSKKNKILTLIKIILILIISIDISFFHLHIITNYTY